MYLLAKAKNKDHVSCLSRLASRLVENILIRLGIFPSPRGYIEGQNMYRGKVGIFPSPRAYIEREVSEFSSLKAYIEE